MTELACVVCFKGCRLHVDERDGYRATGSSYPKGEIYGKKGLIAPTRTITSIVKTRSASIACMLVRTDHEIPKRDTFAVTRLLDGTALQAPVYAGDIVMSSLLGLSMSFVVTRSLTKVSDVGQAIRL